MWKLSLDVENEPPVYIEPAVLIKPAVLNELFLRNVREEKIFYDFKKLSRPSWSTRKIIKKYCMQYSVLLNKDQQKMAVKLFFLVSRNIFSNFLLMNLLRMNRTQQKLLFSNEGTIILIETFLKKLTIENKKKTWPTIWQNFQRPLQKHFEGAEDEDGVPLGTFLGAISKN